MSTVPEQLSVFPLPPRAHGSQAELLSHLEGNAMDKRRGSIMGSMGVSLWSFSLLGHAYCDYHTKLVIP